MKIVKLDEIDKVDIQSYFEDVVVIPTETVYGLAARIDNEKALNNIFKIKGRPSDNPLIVHISDRDMLDNLVDGDVPAEYSILMDRFWPGPLTLLFKCKDSVSRTLTGKDISTIAVRMPKGEKIRDLIKRIGVPLAAPSANTSGKPSPTRVAHVMDDLGERVSLYIDGGPCEIGIESTVFGIIDNSYMILRPGGVTKESIEKAINKKVLVKNKVENSDILICPGQKYKHYSPEHPVYLFTGSTWRQNISKYSQVFENMKIGILKRRGLEYPIEFYKEYDLGECLQDCTRNIFAGLRVLDRSCDVIFVVGFELEKEGLAIMDRLEKAASHIID
ncbi:Sua5/YciO/YrdC/YwlC family protein [Vittaforma corneae ATCC 50505]|uniref:Threonylcarbamoyl-AMP synthase n=1 Tax=Vittaforma corneae (strain ATCC 50505) TaxID=993615 RepID=L2GQS2_VITCO|nr:Sua5/YciO/YrdC/YwlC family protein [Vittaforma corneae ATCC 50505]ELA42865.1 Sua5/YciO/YrdC/YwlC family protein [Vittaforma corneae ATCC 50505]